MSALRWLAHNWAWLLVGWAAFCAGLVAFLFVAGALARRTDRRMAEKWPHARGVRR